MKFLHTADWQMGLRAAGLGDRAKEVREERLAAGRRVAEAARTHRCEFMLVAGDVFEDNGVDRLLVQKVADILSSFGAPVYIIPGNHDPYVPGSVWEHPAWSVSETLRVIKEPSQISIRGGTLYACPLRSKHSSGDPTSWIPKEEGTGVRIGLAHGTVEGVQQDEPDFPISRDAAERSGLDYLALGHWHSFAVFPSKDTRCRMAYSGTPEQTSFGEGQSGNALIVEMAGPGAPVSLTPVRTGGLSWVNLEKEIRDVSGILKLKEEIEALPEPGRTLVQVRIKGLMPAEGLRELEHLTQITQSRFFHARVSTSDLLPAPGDDAWISRLPQGILREAAHKLQSQSLASGPSAEVASRALMDLYAIAEEASR